MDKAGLGSGGGGRRCWTGSGGRTSKAGVARWGLRWATVSPFVKYMLARLGLFGIVAAALLAVPLDIDVLLKLMIAVAVSAGLSFWLLKGLREEASVAAVGIAERRAEKRERLRAALNGDDDGGASATKAD